MTIRLKDRGPLMAWAVTALYLTLVAVWTVAIGRAFIHNLPTQPVLLAIGGAISLAAWPLVMMTDKIYKGI